MVGWSQSLENCSYTMAVKCVLCKKSFNKKETLKNHFIEEHNVPGFDEVLNRYVNLRFSTSTGNVERKMSMLIRLLKLLKKKVAYHTIAREKVQLSKSNIEIILDKFIDSNETDSTASIESDVSENNWNKFRIVKWLLKYYDVFINKNKDIKKEEKDSIVSFFTNAERQFTKCMRLKLEQKKNTWI